MLKNDQKKKKRILSSQNEFKKMSKTNIYITSLYKKNACLHIPDFVSVNYKDVLY